MIKPGPKVIVAAASAVRQNPELLEWVEGWWLHELEQLPHTQNNTALKQGRCQVLDELRKFLRDAPDVAAKLR